MCFSAGASFTAAGALGSTGIIFVSKFYRDKRLWIALIPCFFAIQQAAEGFLWLAFNWGVFPNGWSLAAESLYLFFAYCFWPVWMPLALLRVEEVPWRKAIMKVLLLIGCFYFALGGFAVWKGLDEAHVVHHSISYGEVSLWTQLLYAIVVISPFFLSSIPKMWILGLAILLSFIVATLAFAYAFTSVWCFAAALICLGIYLVFRL
jgi:hypothetical protein